MEKLNSDLSATLRGTNFFATGDECTAVGLNLKCIPGKGVNLSAANQTLRDGFLTAQQVFEHVAPETIKFVIIGLSPNASDISPTLEEYIKLCNGNGARPVVVTFPVEASLRKTFDADNLQSLRNEIVALAKKHDAAFIDLIDAKLANGSFQEERLLNAKGAAEASTLLVKNLCLKGVISPTEFLSLDKVYRAAPFKRLREQYMTQVTQIFCDIACKDFNRLSATLPADECKDLMARVFSDLTYDHLAKLSDMLTKDDYNDVAARIFELSAKKIRRKDKIKVGFHFSFSSFWFGDELYNLFARDERFEPTVFITTKSNNKVVDAERSLDAKRFAAHGVNVFDLNDRTHTIPAQDVLFCLTPYQADVPRPFRLINLKLTTLLSNVSYGFTVCDRGKWHGSSFFRVLWKIFFPSMILLNLFEKISKVGMARGFYSGYPKMDVLFRKDADLHFDWKTARPDAKKIIWAPHHSITNSGPLLATFHWNYQFMYEFAKAHPETAWVIKTHSALSQKAVANKIFPTIEAYEEYLQKWNDLPNAQVYTGAYYQAIFATSDGMIQDSGSFIAEYQYVDKPMIYLTRDTQKFNELGKEILDASYCVDGKDLDGIAAMIQRVFIDGDDYKAAERKAVFDKYLNYPKANGMLASEFIFKNIAAELTAPK